MFRLIRYFSIASLIAFFIAILIVTYLSRSIAISDMVQIREQSNIELAQLLGNLVWSEYGDFITSATTLDSETLIKSPQFIEFDAAIRLNTAGLSIIKIKIFAPDGMTIYSSNVEDMGVDASQKKGFVDAVQYGVASELIYRDTFNAFEGAVVDRNIVESYVPIYTHNRETLVGVLEVYEDVTPLMRVIFVRQLRIIMGLFTVFTLLYIILFYVVRYADRILNGQAAEIQLKNAELALINDKLKAANQLATEATRLKSEFLSTMSHELRTPLNAIIGYSGIITEGITGDVNGRTLGMIQKIHQSGEHLLGLINDILDISKIEAGRMEIVEDKMSVTAVIENVHSQIQVLADKKQLVFDIAIDAKMPHLLLGDSDRIKQILINLLSNSVKFTDNGTVSLNADWHDNKVVFKISDTGIGIPPHALDYIFDEFRQVNSTSTRTYQGTGLGLAIVRKFTEAMQGTVTVESRFGNGTTFTVTLPLREVHTQTSLAS